MDRRLLTAWPGRSQLPSREPLVIGAIGEYDSKVVEKMVDGTGCRKRHARSGVVIHSNGPLATRKDRLVRIITWNQPMSCGVRIGRTSIELFPDLLGASPLFVADVGSATYFSNRLWPVARARGQATIDPHSAACLLTLWYVPPGRSLLHGIETLDTAEVVHFDIRSRMISRQRVSDDLEIAARASVTDLVSAVADAIPDHGNTAILLSGGLDSRFLLACCLHAGRRAEAFTSDKNDGSTADIETAQKIAEAAKMNHTVVGSAGTWINCFAATARRVDYATPHHSWVFGLAEHLRARGPVAVMGFGGGIALNSHLQEPNDDYRGRYTDARLALFHRLGGQGLFEGGPLQPALSRATSDWTISQFLEHTARYQDHHCWQALSILTTRTARSISLMATRLVGPEIPVIMPYLNPRVLSLALSHDLHVKRGDDQYRTLMESTARPLARLPRASPSSGSVSSHRMPATFKTIARLVTQDDLASSLLSARIRAALSKDPIEFLNRGVWTIDEKAIHGALVIAVLRLTHPEVTGMAGF